MLLFNYPISVCMAQDNILAHPTEREVADKCLYRIGP